MFTLTGTTLAIATIATMLFVAHPIRDFKEIFSGVQINAKELACEALATVIFFSLMIGMFFLPSVFSEF